ncbi:MAG: dihydrolipoamide acetyltransferase family protein [Chloroflexota bacterium]
MPDEVIRLPRLGDSVAQGRIGRWLKHPGDVVERDEPLLEIETDKVNVDVPSPAAGVLRRILRPEGSPVAVDEELAIIGEAGEQDANEPGGPSIARSDADRAPVEPAESGDTGGSVSRNGKPAGDRPLASPLARRIAAEHGLDLERIAGTGLGGRVTRRDVERAGAPGHRATANEHGSPRVGGMPAVAGEVQAPVGAGPAAGPPDRPPEEVYERARPLTPMRQAIARHMAESRRTIPDAWTVVSVDVTRLARLREGMKAGWQERESFALTYLPFMIKAVIGGLRAVDELNATWHEDGAGYTVHHRMHLGIAVSVDAGLLVPVLRDADRYSMVGLARELNALVQKARSGGLVAGDLAGATFTVNNSGALGSVLTQSIVPLGQAGIVTMDAIVKKVVVADDDSIAVRRVMNCCLSFDHRVLDGARALAFLRVVKRDLEEVPDSSLA